MQPHGQARGADSLWYNLVAVFIYGIRHVKRSQEASDGDENGLVSYEAAGTESATEAEICIRWIWLTERRKKAFRIKRRGI